nr:MAG TPA: hypothetical protein [Caudoviricetes sp.]
MNLHGYLWLNQKKSWVKWVERVLYISTTCKLITASDY